MVQTRHYRFCLYCIKHVKSSKFNKNDLEKVLSVLNVLWSIFNLTKHMHLSYNSQIYLFKKKWIHDFNQIINLKCLFSLHQHMGKPSRKRVQDQIDVQIMKSPYSNNITYDLSYPRRRNILSLLFSSFALNSPILTIQTIIYFIVRDENRLSVYLYIERGWHVVV